MIRLHVALLLALFAAGISQGKVPPLILTPEEQQFFAEHGPVVFVSQTNYPPFEFIDYDDRSAGIMIELAQWLGSTMGFAVKFTDTSFFKAQKAVQDGSADVITSFFYSPTRDETFDFTQTIFEVPASIFVYADRPDIVRAQDLAGKKIAMQRGDYAKEFLESRNIEFQKIPTESFLEAAQAVIAGLADALIGDEQIILYYLYRYDLIDQLKISGNPLYVGQNSMAVKSGNTQLQALLDKGITHARAHGVINQIEGKWLGKALASPAFNWKKLWPYALLTLVIIVLIVLRNLDLRRAIKAQTEKLRLNEQRLSYVIDGAHAGTWEWNVRTGLVAYNERWAEIIGYTLAELEPLTTDIWKNSTHPDDLQKSEDALQKHFNGEEAYYRSENRMRHKNGHWVWVLDRGRVYEWSASGKPLLMAGTHLDITELKEAEEALQQSERRYRDLSELLPLAVFEADAQARLTYVNQAAFKMFGYTQHDLEQGIFIPQTIAPEDHERLQKNMHNLVAKQSEQSNIYTAVRKDGTPFIVRVYVTAIVEENRLQGFRGILLDITDQVEAQTQLRIAAVAFESQEAMMVTDANANILQVNQAFSETTGYSAEEVIGKNPRFLQSGYHDETFYEKMWQSITETGMWQGEIWDQRKNGEVFPKWLTISAVRDDQGHVTHYVGSHFDITERKRAEEKIAELAYFDQLTGVPNRTLFNDRIHQAMMASNRSGVYGALLFIDLDNFKTLNDTLGHDTGDDLLKQVARRLTSCVRGEDTVARLGGDEFLVMIANLSDDKTEAANNAELIAEKILTTLNAPYDLSGMTHHSTQSIGVTLFHGDSTPIDELMKQADMAMYKAKASGRDAIRFFDPEMEIAIANRSALEKDLRTAIQEDELELHYQPQIEEGETIIGAEALARWTHPQRGRVSPGEFIPLAEESGLILPLGKWVIQESCRQLARWQQQPELANLTLAINVSPRQFREHSFVEEVLQALAETKADPDKLKIELTESLLVENVEEIVLKMQRLRSHGVHFSLDDFGTGYSSLVYLKKLPLDQLKIDQSFVRDILVDSNDATIAKTIVALSESFGLNVLAEGVEEEAQRQFLLNVGCSTYQGYLFSPPLPVADFEEYVKRHR
ncbi:EAL domain-containing protein [Desulfurispira natronophila]|uniref:Diguanylate cyclase (GGDEF)-like protein/PAS domain S-box-containing protein n=1 Tax=Desulfurispira natronophila TaxID=682562 RepID=A0A7W7Y3B8_9BACT|nr:EAL domain-containing protein [Desulfurispira natronophila]MBB5021174.1 diguanylate cyclase (GGDEF)-like protein/PAS domain S-box-containing protein [Desulfurispira natronophila]